jgi:hypothetical protein
MPAPSDVTVHQCRWELGVVAPRAPHKDGEPWFLQTECLVSGARAERQGPGGHGVWLSLRVRCLRPDAARDGSRRWLDGVPCTIDLGPVDLQSLSGTHLFQLHDVGIDARVAVEVERIGAFLKPRIRLENHERWRALFDDDRDAMLCQSMVGTHLLMSLEGGAFESLLESGAPAASTSAPVLP